MVGLLTGLVFFPVLLSLAGPAAEVSRFLNQNRKKISHTKIKCIVIFCTYDRKLNLREFILILSSYQTLYTCCSSYCELSDTHILHQIKFILPSP